MAGRLMGPRRLAHGGGRNDQLSMAVRGLNHAHSKGCGGRRHEQRPTVDSLAQAGCGQFAQVEADGVFRSVQLQGQLRRPLPAISSKPLQDQGHIAERMQVIGGELGNWLKHQQSRSGDESPAAAVP